MDVMLKNKKKTYFHEVVLQNNDFVQRIFCAERKISTTISL